MSASENPLLTISIPTYNRSVFLDRALKQLSIQLIDQDLPVEVVVSDNCSTDDTESVVKKHIDNGLKLRYVRNPENKGMDFNIAQCYLLAKGQYVVAVGDDDFLLDGSLKLLTDFLQNKDYGVVYFKSKGFAEGATIDKVTAEKLSFTEFTEPIDFVKKVHYYITFISGNIVNTKYLDKDNMLKYLGTSLPQVPFFMNAVLSAKQNVVVDTVLLGVELDNTGGYNLFKVFGKNFNYILDGIQTSSKSLKDNIKAAINRKLLIGFFPDYILKFRLNNKNAFVHTDAIKELKELYAGNFYFYMCCYPIAYLPKGLAKGYKQGVKLFSKLSS
ncbi:glycosyltransferase family 2 protein [Mucilaginibacter angelicae]|uniref:Glycosyltransferase family 2 protein n=1 Tax=Mucilaginibacter angelicae TaxID=869718 RepID=A0ABV6LA07_9SPHI